MDGKAYDAQAFAEVGFCALLYSTKWHVPTLAAICDS